MIRRYSRFNRFAMSMENMSDSMLLDKYNMMCQRYERNLSRGNVDMSAKRQLFRMFNEINSRGLNAPQMDFFYEFYGSRKANAFDDDPMGFGADPEDIYSPEELEQWRKQPSVTPRIKRDMLRNKKHKEYQKDMEYRIENLYDVEGFDEWLDKDVKYRLEDYKKNRKSYRRLSVAASKKDSE